MPRQNFFISDSYCLYFSIMLYQIASENPTGTITAHKNDMEGPDMDDPKKKQDETVLDSEVEEGEINPGKLDREELIFDQAGADNSKAHEPYEF